jgi:hypothetical protein
METKDFLYSSILTTLINKVSLLMILSAPWVDSVALAVVVDLEEEAAVLAAVVVVCK